MDSNNQKYDLALVMPVYNEEECIVDVINSWIKVLNQLEISFYMLIINDGSTDQTADKLDTFKDYSSIKVIHKMNSGHGPTILMGYQQAVEIAHWVFQCDSDDEMKAKYFSNLWQRRKNYQALLGIRANRSQNLSRKFISACSRLIIKIFFGEGITDVNTPYRLLRSDILKKIIYQLPVNCMVPNVIISGVLTRSGCKTYECNVPYQMRKTGSISIVKFKLWILAYNALWQTVSSRNISFENNDVH